MRAKARSKPRRCAHSFVAVAVVFTILIVILLFRPAGLLGARVREKADV